MAYKAKQSFMITSGLINAYVTGDFNSLNIFKMAM